MSGELTFQKWADDQARASEIENLKRQWRASFMNDDPAVKEMARDARRRIFELGHTGGWAPADRDEYRDWSVTVDVLTRPRPEPLLSWQHDDWRPWFAWRPVTLNCGRTAWFTTVRRRWQEAVLHGWEYTTP